MLTKLAKCNSEVSQFQPSNKKLLNIAHVQSTHKHIDLVIQRAFERRIWIEMGGTTALLVSKGVCVNLWRWKSCVVFLGWAQSWHRDCGVTDEMCAIRDTQPRPRVRVSERRRGDLWERQISPGSCLCQLWSKSVPWDTQQPEAGSRAHSFAVSEVFCVFVVQILA